MSYWMSVHWLFGFGRMSISCTPHFKSDAERPWVTRESVTSLHYWYNPEKEQTLLEVAEQIERWIHYDYEALVPRKTGLFASYAMNILSMEIRGVEYDRQALAIKTTRDSYRNEEPFTIRFDTKHGRGQTEVGQTEVRRVGCVIL